VVTVPLAVAVKSALPSIVAALTTAVNVPETAPVGICIEDGTAMFALSEERLTTKAFEPAFPVRVTMH